MATSKDYLEYVTEQLSDIDGITYKQMMGEYIIYCKGRIAAYLCDNRLLIKPVPAAVQMIPDAEYEPPYEGAKEMLLCNRVDDREFLTRLFGAIYPQLPEPKPKAALKIKKLPKKDIPTALGLALGVFMQYEAPEYSEEGITEFRKTLSDESYIAKLTFYGAYESGSLVGVLAMREPQHIGLFFVQSEFQGRGIGGRLFRYMQKDYAVKEFTVNSSPYAVTIYEKLGFVPTDAEQVTNGIRYTPMRYTAKA